MKEIIKKCVITFCSVSTILLGSMTAYAAGPGTDTQTTQPQSIAQSDRWEGTGDTWKVRTADNSGYLTNSWLQDTDNSWYMLGSDGVMYSGLITDQSTGKSYLLNTQHDGTYGRMLTVDGVYNVNGSQVYLTFNQAHDGTYGAITSGLAEARGSGVKETRLAAIPTDSSGQPQPENPSKPQTPQNTQQNTNNSQGTQLSDEAKQHMTDIFGTPPSTADAGSIDPGHFNGGLSSH